MSKTYFNKETEEKIVLYNNTTSDVRRNIIYKEHIYEPLYKIANGLYNKYFTSNYFEEDKETVLQDAIIHMTSILSTFTESRGKAFGYLSVCCKNWLIQKNTKAYKTLNQHVFIDNIEYFDVEDETVVVYQEQSTVELFFNDLIDFWEYNLRDYFDREVDLKIANAFIYILKNKDRLSIFKKKAIYIYIRELTDCKTSQITSVIKIMKEVYEAEKKGILEETIRKEYGTEYESTIYG